MSGSFKEKIYPGPDHRLWTIVELRDKTSPCERSRIYLNPSKTMESGFVPKLKQFLINYKLMMTNWNYLRLLFSYALVHGILMCFFMIARKMIGGMIDGRVNLKIGQGFIYRRHLRELSVHWQPKMIPHKEF